MYTKKKKNILRMGTSIEEQKVLPGADPFDVRRIHTHVKKDQYFALVQTGGNISLIAERNNSVNRTAHA